jgi:polyhydroxyalkanoate synthase subunit PhaE
MMQESPRKTASEPLLAAWIKWTMDFWETMAQMGPSSAGAGGKGGGSSRQAAVPEEPWLFTIKLWQAFFSLLTEPETIDAVFKGIKAPSEIILRMAQAGWGGYFHLHRQWLEGGQGDAPPTGETGYEDLDQDISKFCNKIYEQDFRQLLNLPHLGLTGLNQGCVTHATEKFNQFQAAMAEFTYLLYLPVKKSLQAMRAEGRKGGEEQPLENFKEYYRRWLKILEGHYMTLFQGADYTRILSRILRALEEFTLAKQELLAEAMGALGLPTRKDLAGLYREIYLLKKSVKGMARKLEQLEPVREEG